MQLAEVVAVAGVAGAVGAAGTADIVVLAAGAAGRLEVAVAAAGIRIHTHIVPAAAAATAAEAADCTASELGRPVAEAEVLAAVDLAIALVEGRPPFESTAPIAPESGSHHLQVLEQVPQVLRAAEGTCQG